MGSIFCYELRRFRGQILGWGLALFLLGLLVVPLYDTVVQQRQQIQQVLKGLPAGLVAFIGNIDTMFSPDGFLGIRYFMLMPVILGIFAVIAGSGLLAADEEKGVLDLVLAHPVSRRSLFLGRLAAFVTAMLAILAVGWLGLLLPMSWSTLSVGGAALARPFLSLLAVLLVFGSLALALSMLLPARRLAAMLSGLALVGSYFLTSFARIHQPLERFAAFSPLNYYQSGEAILGLNGRWLAGLLTVAALLTALAWRQFERRDIRVAGEGVWRWPWQSKRAA